MNRPGFVLVVTLFVLLAVGLMGAGVLFVGTQQRRIAQARVDAVRARFAAEAGAAAAVAGWSTAAHADLDIGGSEPLPSGGALPGGFRHRTTVERLAGGQYLVRSMAVAPSGRSARHRIGLRVQSLDPRAIWEDFPAAVTTGGAVRVEGAGGVDGSEAASVPDRWPASACPADAVPTMMELFGTIARPGIVLPDGRTVYTSDAAALEGRPPVRTDPLLTDPEEFHHLGPLTLERARRLADRREPETVGLGPQFLDGECDASAPGNWGAPHDPLGPCGDYFPLISADGDLTVADGAGQGILVVDGDLVLEEGVRFYGIVLTTGTLTLRPGAAIDGAARSAGGVRVDGGRIRYSACAVWRALTRSPLADRPFRPAGRLWTPVF